MYRGLTRQKALHLLAISHANVLLKLPYKFKKSYGGTPEPQTAQGAPWLHGPSLKKIGVVDFYFYFI
jgi:hypothetical protein